MKQNILVVFLLLSFHVFSQKESQNVMRDDDLMMRRSMASRYLKENSYDYKSGEGKALHNIMMDVFCKNSTIILLNLSNVPNTDDSKNLTSLVEGLNSLLIITPTWEELVQLEKNRVLLEDKWSNRSPQLIENKK